MPGGTLPYSRRQEPTVYGPGAGLLLSEVHIVSQLLRSPARRRHAAVPSPGTYLL